MGNPDIYKIPGIDSLAFMIWTEVRNANRRVILDICFIFIIFLQPQVNEIMSFQNIQKFMAFLL